MENENKVVMGLFNSRSAIETTVDRLRAEGFRSADISALLPSDESTKELAHVNATKVPEGAAVGGATGGVLGGVIGWLAGVGALTIPGVGPLIAAGPIVGALAGLGVGSAAGSLTGALIGYGVPEYEAKRYEGFVKSGGYLLTVHCDNDDWVEKAKRIFQDCGAHEVSSSDESGADSDDAISDDIPRSMNAR